jgi:hypothetical protein
MQAKQDADDDVLPIEQDESPDDEPVVQKRKNATPKTHACPYEDCDKVFSRPWMLARHMNVHKGVVCCWSLDVALTYISLDKNLLFFEFNSNTIFGAC